MNARKLISSFGLFTPYLQHPFANFAETNAGNPQTRLLYVLVADFRPFSLLFDPLRLKIDLNFCPGD